MIYSPLEQFEIHILDINILFLHVNGLMSLRFMDYAFGGPLMYLGWINVSITNATVALLIATLLLGCELYGSNTYKIIPSKQQSLVEIIYEFIHGLVEEQIGIKGYEYFIFIYSLFIFILSCNLLGMIPYAFTVTSHVVITFGLSIAVFIGVTSIGFLCHGLHFFNLLVPAGVPLPLLPLIITIEFVSYLTRGLSLGIRLAANMFAGHTLLKIISTFAAQMLTSKIYLLVIAGLAPVLLLFALTGLEIVIALLQAYVFTVLTCSYLNDAIHLH